MISIDTSCYLFASCVSKLGRLKVLWLKPKKTLIENQQLLNEGLDYAFYDKKSENLDIIIIDMSVIKFVYFVGGLAFYFTEVPDFKTIKELLR